MMSIKQSSLHYNTLAKLKAEQDESQQRRTSTSTFSNFTTQDSLPTQDVFKPTESNATNNPLANEAETPVAKKESFLHRLNPFKRGKKKTDEHHLEVSPELVTLAVVGYASTLNPAVAAGLASKIDSQFFWDFTILDFVGMGFPRISRSLQRGALPYDPKKDPEAQRRKGLDKWVYIKRKESENANWVNLREEMLREVQAAPGSLLVPALVFGFVPLLSRNKFLSWTGRRTLHMSEKEVTQEYQNLTHFLSEQSVKPQGPKDSHTIEKMGHDYVERVFKSIPEATRHEKVAIDFKGNTVINPYYHMSNGHLKTLKEGLKDDELFGLKTSLNTHTQLNKNSILSLDGVSLDKIVTEVAHVQGKLIAFDVKYGAGSIFFNQALRQEHHFLTAKMQALYTIAEQTALKVNAIHSPHSRIKEQMTYVDVMHGKGFTQAPLLECLQNIDKGRDLMVASLQNFFNKKGTGELKEALAQSFNTIKATKSFITMGSLVWMMGWMWYLAHAIQKGREYPANRLVKLSKPKEEEVSKNAPVASQLPSEIPVTDVPLNKKAAIRQRLKYPQDLEEGKAS